MPSRAVPGSFTVTKACVIEGNTYARGDVVDAGVAKAFKKLNVLVANRTLLPNVEQYGRETDAFGFGATPRKHPTPTYYNPTETGAMS